MYAFTENFVLPLSHDEVVHGKGSLLSKMPGDDWQKLANLRLLYAYMFGAAGQEAAVHGRRDRPVAGVEPRRRASTGTCCEHPAHAGITRWLEDLNRLYRAEPALHELDASPDGFEWIDANDAENSVLSFLRKARDPKATPVLVVLNFTPVPRDNYRVGVPVRGLLERAAQQRRSRLRRQRPREHGWRGGHAGPPPRPALLPDPRSAPARRAVPAAGPAGREMTVWQPTLGAVYLGDRKCRFRVWAPLAERLEVELSAIRTAWWLWIATRRAGSRG